MGEVNGAYGESDDEDEADEEILRAIESDGGQEQEEEQVDEEVFHPPPPPDASGEAVAPRLLRSANQPSKREVEEHRRNSHLPYRPWCKLRVFGKGKNDQHRSG